MNIGKKILSALIELPDEDRRPDSGPVTNINAQPINSVPAADTDKFRRHFEQLLEEANGPGPDYFEFFRMIAAMRAIGDESARYAAAFAGLQPQGLTKEKLLESAQANLALLNEDAARFRSTVDHAQHEKVQARRSELEANTARIAELRAEITRLEQRNLALQAEVGEQEQRLEASRRAYEAAWQDEQERVRQDIEKISKHIS
ncbi:MAG: hypothetical protein EOO16_04425 [Chitinophagaceae bacterium]|nr:MAG: hypothetical protein EOO16_04425 [Chitinophagaceae bacterium]